LCKNGREGANVLKRKLIALSTIILVLSLPTIAQADLQQNLSNYQHQYKDLENQQNAQKQKENELVGQVAGLNQSTRTLNANIALQERSIKNNQAEIKKLKDQQKQLTDQKEKNLQELRFILRMNYMGSPLNYLEGLFESKSLIDMLDKVEQINYIVKGFDKSQKEIVQLNQEISEKKSLSEQKSSELQAALESLKTSKASTEQAAKKQKDLLSQLNAEQRATLNSKNQTQANIDYVQQLIIQEQIDAENAKKNPVVSDNGGGSISQPVKLTGTVGDLIAYAERFIGVRYLWGGTTPSGFDCSGYTQYVFRNFGINLPRVSQDQFNVGTAVSKGDLKPGDLVFFSTYGPGATHVGIFIGGDTMIDSESRGVTVTSLFSNNYWSPRYIGARRVIQN